MLCYLSCSLVSSTYDYGDDDDGDDDDCSIHTSSLLLVTPPLISIYIYMFSSYIISYILYCNFTLKYQQQQ